MRVIAMLFAVGLIGHGDAATALCFVISVLAMLVGFCLGTIFGASGRIEQFKDHIDRHTLSPVAVADCEFCKLERPHRVRRAGGRS